MEKFNGKKAVVKAGGFERHPVQMPEQHWSNFEQHRHARPNVGVTFSGRNGDIDNYRRTLSSTLINEQNAYIRKHVRVFVKMVITGKVSIFIKTINDMGSVLNQICYRFDRKYLLLIQYSGAPTEVKRCLPQFHDL